MIADAKLTRLSESAFSIKNQYSLQNIVLRIQALLLFLKNNPVKSFHTPSFLSSGAIQIGPIVIMGMLLPSSAAIASL